MPSGRPAAGVADVDVLTGVVDEVLASRRYRWLARELVERIARDELRKARRPADAVKATKVRLHQVFGAYATEIEPLALRAEMEAAAAGGPAALRACLRRLMERHASTRERLPALETFFPRIFEVTGTPRSVVDLACGLGPLALPWMGLLDGATYHAFDIDARFVDLARACMDVTGTVGGAALCDVAAGPPGVVADVALLFKAAPCLEQQAPGSAAHLVRDVQARWVVVSFPVRSLGGHARGMPAHYRRQMERLIAGEAWTMREIECPVELVFVVDKVTAGAGRGDHG